MYTPKYVNYMFEMFKIQFILCCFQYVLKTHKNYIYIYICVCVWFNKTNKKKMKTKYIYIYIYIY